MGTSAARSVEDQDRAERAPRTGLRRATLGLPVYNERARIRQTLLRLNEQLATLPYHWEILVIDDGSTDGSVEETVRAAFSSHLPVRLLSHGANHGLGGALSTIFRECRGDLVVTVDADLTYSADHIPVLVQAWEQTQAAVVVASPYAEGGSTVDVPHSLEVRSRWANRYLASMSGVPIATFTGIVRVYDGDFVRSLPPLRGGSFANVEVLYEACRQQRLVVEVPARLDWSGQQERRRRHEVASPEVFEEAAHVLAEGVRLRHLVRRVRKRLGGESGVHRVMSLPGAVPMARGNSGT